MWARQVLRGRSAVVALAALAVSVSAADVSTVQAWFAENFADGQTQLFAGSGVAVGDEFSVCGGLPALVTRSTTVAGNGGCPEALTAVNGSCTCITGFSKRDEAWTFRLTAKSGTGTRQTGNAAGAALTIASDKVLEVDAVRPLWVPATLRILEFVGVDSSPMSLTFVPDDLSGPTNATPIARSSESSVNVTSLAFVNIDMYQTALNAVGLIPSSVANITMRNCNVSSFGYEFPQDIGSLRSIDLSLNKLTKAYAGSTAHSSCSYSLCALEVFNVSFNEMSAFPTSAMNVMTLRKFYMQGNPIADWNVSTDIFERVLSLDVLVADDLDKSTLSCGSGEWKSAHGITFCVTSGSDPGNNTSGVAASSGSSTRTLQYVAMGGGLVVILLVLVLVWQRRQYKSDLNEEGHSGSRSRRFGQSSIMGTTTRGDNDAAMALLLREPHLASQRVDYRDIKLTKCLSRGGFGLVFSGELYGRSVAIKKMRADRGVEIQQLELFVREIALMARLRHSRIVEFIGLAWESPSLMDLAAITELMEGGDLREVLHYHYVRRNHNSNTGSTSSGSGQPAREASEATMTWSGSKLKIALHIAQALEYLHSRSPPVVHRDLKSKNVLLTPELDAKLTDFGISRERPDHANEMMTAGIGTNFWIAPEVLLGEDYDERADIFSFGVVLSEIDTDDFPYWNAEHPAGGKMEEGAILQAVAMGKKRPAFSQECPPAILVLASRCLSVSPHERPSAVELVHHLERMERSPSERESDDRNYAVLTGLVEPEFDDWMYSGDYSDMSDLSDYSDFDEDKKLDRRRHRRLDDSARAISIRHEGIYK